ncbi:aldehyde ferredoxin oxidoreductase N-terminal domain-containing protein [Chloroflexota bacterium]
MTNDFGYTGKILRVDLSSESITDIPTVDYADRFIGGRGIAAKIYWDEVSPDIKAFDPENRLLFVTGPLAGLSGLAGSRWQVCGKSPATTPEHFCYSSFGGSWGAYLKFAGYDGIVVQGKADKPVYLFLHDGICEIRDASHLWGKGAIKVREELKSELGSATRVVASGPSGDNMVVLATLLADNDACGTGGFGAVMGSKKLKAIAVAGGRKVTAANPDKLRELTQYIRELRRGATTMARGAPTRSNRKKELCYGCINGCGRSLYTADNGQQGKFMCEAASFYRRWAGKYYEGQQNDVPFQATKLCDNYGLDIRAIVPMITWFSRCAEAGILTDESTGIPISKVGSLEFIETLVEKISLRDGFGDILAQGIFRAADLVGHGAKEQIADYTLKAEQSMAYCPRMYITNGLLYMVEPRQPIQELHEISRLVSEWLKWVENREGASLSSEVFRSIAKRFWGSELAADFSAYEGKALAAKRIQDRQYAKECLILCDNSWPITYVQHSEDHIGDPTIESKVFFAVTGQEIDEDGLYRLGERVFNLQRAILVREGHHGRASDTLPEPCYTVPMERGDWNNAECLVIGKDGQAITKKGAMLEREEFEKLKDEYYTLRGWDVTTGLQTEAKLEEVGLGDIGEDLKRRGLVL